MSPITLKISTEADADFVNTLTYETMHSYVERIWTDQSDLDHYYHLNKFDAANTKIIMCGERRVGRFSVKREKTRFYIDSIHLLPEFQGNGIASRLIQDVIAEGIAMGLPVELTVLETNPAKQLYERLGFRSYKQENHRFYMRHLK